MPKIMGCIYICISNHIIMKLLLVFSGKLIGLIALFALKTTLAPEIVGLEHLNFNRNNFLNFNLRSRVYSDVTKFCNLIDLSVNVNICKSKPVNVMICTSKMVYVRNFVCFFPSDII